VRALAIAGFGKQALKPWAIEANEYLAINHNNRYTHLVCQFDHLIRRHPILGNIVLNKLYPPFRKEFLYLKAVATSWCGINLNIHLALLLSGIIHFPMFCRTYKTSALKGWHWSSPPSEREQLFLSSANGPSSYQVIGYGYRPK
jgi:hypothetical protein